MINVINVEYKWFSLNIDKDDEEFYYVINIRFRNYMGVFNIYRYKF